MSYYSSLDYWEGRYSRDNTVFEWYQTYQDLRGLILRFANVKEKVMIAGIGTSEMGENMFSDGYNDVTCVDFCTAAICAMELRKRKLLSNMTASGRNLTYVVSDLTMLDKFKTGTFTTIIDKATLDGCMCGTDEAAQYTYCLRILRELHRVLRPGGKLLILSHAPRESRRVFENHDLGLKVEVHVLPKPSDFLDAEAAAIMDEGSKVHYFYVLTKAAQ